MTKGRPPPPCLVAFLLVKWVRKNSPTYIDNTLEPMTPELNNAFDELISIMVPRSLSLTPVLTPRYTTLGFNLLPRHLQQSAV